MDIKDAKEYEMFEEELDVIHIENLQPELKQVYSTVMPLYRIIDNKYPSSIDQVPPERYIPIMEGDGRSDGMRQEIKYMNNLWQLIFYAERSNKIERIKSFSDINELAFFLVVRYAYGRAGRLLTEKGIGFNLTRQHKLKIEIVHSINQQWGKRLESGERLELFYEGGK